MPSSVKKNNIDHLPVSAWDWMLFLYQRLSESQRGSAQEQKCARVLFQLMLTGGFDGASLYEKQGPCESYITMVPKYVQSSRTEFGLGKTGATRNQQIVYFEILASLVKREYTLTDILPTHYLNLEDQKDEKQEWVEAFSSEVDILEPESHICWDIGRELKKGKFKGAQRHAVLLLWSFWVISNHEWIKECPVDLFNFKQMLQQEKCQDTSEFVNTAM